MEIPMFLAMTAGEVLYTEALPRHLGWMACHFSPYGRGLSNLPEALPKGSMLMLNDRMPPDWHDVDLSAEMLVDAAKRLECGCILLDFQRPDNEKTASVVEAVLKRSHCPAGVSSCYAEGLNCPVLVPPVPPHLTVQEHLEPWQGREIWLECSLMGTKIEVTTEGSRYTTLPRYVPSEKAHFDEELGCRYEITVEEERVVFRLGRLLQDMAELLEKGNEYGVTLGVGLWQECRNF